MKELIVSPSPHIRSGNSTQKIMLDVIIALVPALIASVVIFGPRAALITAVCVGSCVLFEYLCRLIMKREQTISDLSAVVTGILLAMNLPVTIPLWVAIFGCFIAIVVAKQLFGGIGQNFANPAIAARVILLASFSGYMTAYTVPFDHAGVDAVLGATPLAQLASGGEVPTLLNMFLGAKGGCIGEVSYIDNPPVMNDEIKALIEHDRKELSGEFCRGCGYCMPCPAGIEINNCARMSLMLRRAPSEAQLTPQMQEKMKKIENCLHCNKCKSKCPYGLDTPTLLQKNYEDRSQERRVGKECRSRWSPYH